MASDKNGEDAKADNDIVNAFRLDTDPVFQKDRNIRCASDTGQWFFHHPEYEAFRDTHGLQLLLVTAEAGGGKSTVMRTFVDRLQASDDRPVVAYFFFKDDDDQLRSYEDALSSMINQLFVQERGLIRHARDLYKQYGYGIRYRTKDLWNILLAAATETHRGLICILDAVDECAPAGRRQLVSDMAVAFESGVKTTSTELKFVVTSRPYQDENRSYIHLIASDTIRHLAGEDAKLQSDIQAIIRIKAEELAKKHRLTQNTLNILVQTISSQNQQTRSFLAVRMAFELLDSHDLMQEGADEDIIRAILADIPHTLGDQFDKMLNRTPDKEHARRLFCVIIAARKTLNISELKVIYALTQPRDMASGSPRSYDDLQIPMIDEEFKRLVRARCGLFVTFVKSSVHLFHQTAREYLMADPVPTSTGPSDDSKTPTMSELHTAPNMNQQQTWKGCITKADANLVMLTVCTDLFSFYLPRSWVLSVFDSLNAGNGFDHDIKALLLKKPVLQYASFNWYEHAMLGGDNALAALMSPRYAPVLDVSKTSFWVWFLVLADYLCSNRAKPESLISSVWEDDYKNHRLSAIPHTKGPIWTVGDGYDLIDRFHLAYGEYEYTSFSRAAQCVESGLVERSAFLTADTPIPTMIWTCISVGAPNALKGILSTAKDMDWLHQVPEHTMYRRILWHGSCSATGEDLRKYREQGWTEAWPPAFFVLLRATFDHPNAEVFGVLADWLVSSDHAKDYAQQLWQVGGFLEHSLCRRLVNAGAPIDGKCRDDGITALQVVSALWEHDTVDTLIELGADPTKQTANGLTALQAFLCGPENILKDERFSVSSRTEFKDLPLREQQRRRKSRISLTLRALCRALPTQSPLVRTNATGKYPLMLAVQGSQTATQGLIRAGADVEQADRWGRTALMHFFCGSFTGRSAKTLKHILDAGADSSASDAAGHTVLHYWVRQVFAMDLASLYPGFNRFNKSFEALTKTGALSDDDALIRALVPLEFPLAAAVRLGNTKLCWALCMAGASPDKHGLTTKTRLPESNGSVAMYLEDLSWKPLLIALMHKAYTTAAIVMAYGANVTFKTPSRKRTKYNKHRVKDCGTTALHVAVRSQSKDYGGSSIALSTGRYSGCTFLAVGNPEFKVSKESPDVLMLKLSVNNWKKGDWYKKRFKDDSSDSEYEVPKNRTHNDNTGDKLLPYDKLSEFMLQSVHAKLDDPLYLQIIDPRLTREQRQYALVELLLKKGAPINAKTQEGRTPLHIIKSNPSLARLLLLYGADPNVATTDGLTPLMQAAAQGDRELVEILLAAGADADAQLNIPPLIERKCSSFIERNKWTFHQCDAPLTALAVAAERGHYEVVELLLKYGADPNKPIEHHAHGRLPSKRDKRREARHYGESDSSDSEVEPEEWKGYISVGTAFSWARDQVRELLLRNGADPAREEPLRE
ncbi:uncharacterized protein N0V89_000679 [Didymosphaeria variabile]|uniref:Nephrocystin 3-like N-terminal domain-containing protein n=1 Tax=Didymosphaeria variabile TaxID=1932322 RepID=A0A9W8XXV5_9PLEO|nr:uncharacterized protein N0V89_000679 [Didymosphaeria variabile]KAJ4360119.1 hypothetical protein N0V89_000679 [Didymosphaeria variabile]